MISLKSKPWFQASGEQWGRNIICPDSWMFLFQRYEKTVVMFDRFWHLFPILCCSVSLRHMSVSLHVFCLNVNVYMCMSVWMNGCVHACRRTCNYTHTSIATHIHMVRLWCQFAFSERWSYFNFSDGELIVTKRNKPGKGCFLSLIFKDSRCKPAFA